MVPLFLPADRLDRLPKAIAAKPDAVILDLEDGVASGSKKVARSALAGLPRPSVPIIVRINSAASPWHADDVAVCRHLEWPVTIMLAKFEDVADLGALRGFTVWGLVETCVGLACVRDLAAAPVVRLAFGSVDFAADLGCAHDRIALHAARSELVLASRLRRLLPPVDGVTLEIDDFGAITSDARHAASLGFDGKLCIHPAQIRAVRAGFRPSGEQIAWARQMLEADPSHGGGVARAGGRMVDAPVRALAERILARAGEETGAVIADKISGSD